MKSLILRTKSLAILVKTSYNNLFLTC